MAEMISETEALESTTVGIYRTAAVVKGGRRFSFAALVVVGDRRGRVGIGYGKATGVPMAIEKAQKDARKGIQRVRLLEGTIPHEVDARFGASQVKLVPAAPGTGVIAGATARAVLELAGVKDCLTKSYGSTNQKNLARAVLAGLLSLRNKSEIAKLRGVEIDPTDVESRLELGRKYAPVEVATHEKAKGPVSTVGKGRGGGQRGQRGGRGRGRDQAAPERAPEPAATPAPAQDAPSAPTDANESNA